jgi:Family of unknown function (DUF6445)
MSATGTQDFRPNASVSARVAHFGQEREPAVIIDDVLADPQLLIDHAARQSFAAVTGNLYPGIRSPLPADYLRLVLALAREPARRVFGLSDLDLARVEGDFSIVTAKPSELQLLQCLPHFDTTDRRQLAVLHYLCGPEQGGTAFYRHRATGYESVDASRHDVYMATLGGELKANGPPPRDYIRASTALFEQTGILEARFNRVVIYRSATLHSGMIPSDSTFDPDPRKGRLTANAFLLFRDAARA